MTDARLIGRLDRRSAPLLIAGLAAGAAAIAVLWLAARPLATEDLWFHLAMGKVYAAQGPWPAGGDPLLHTGLSGAPIQHEWLFGLGVWIVERMAGLYALRALHLLAAAGVLWVGFRLLRREAGTLWALFGTAAFCVLAYQRLIQLRPDLVSIPATFAVYAALLGPRSPGRRTVAAMAALFLVWVNVHSLFAVGLCLLVAGAVGLSFRGLLLRELDPGAGADTLRRARGLLVLLLLFAAITLLNPRGVGQHLTFLESSSGHAIWAINDEWAPFWPFAHGPPDNSASLHLLTFWVADGLLVAFFAAALVALRGHRAAGTRESLDRFHPVLFFGSCAAILAFLVSVRFLWFGLLPLAYVGHVLRPRLEESGPARWATAALTAAMAMALPGPGGLALRALDTPRDLSAYLGSAANEARYCEPGVRFLEEAGLAGNLFNPYPLGGYLAWRLAPRLRTFIDGRTEHYGPEVLEEYGVVSAAGVTEDGRHWLELLEERRVDVFFAVGGRYPYRVPDTTRLLEGHPGWGLIYAEPTHRIYLRRNDRNETNWDRVRAWYAHRGLSLPEPTR